jgi:glycosyltransferase involved in cell wall biosynthesis
MSGAADGFIQVPDDALQLALELDRASTPLAEANAEITRRMARSSGPVRISVGDRVVVPELFYDSRRTSLHTHLRNHGARFSYIIFDMLPWIRPEFFQISDAAALMPYLHLIAGPVDRSFISSAVRQDFKLRVLRRPDLPDEEVGAVLPLGADGLGAPHAAKNPSKAGFVCLGTFDGRKKQELVLAAFRLLGDQRKARLTYVGRVPDNPPSTVASVLKAQSDRVRIISNASDDEVLDQLADARASVYINPEEGYGLPAVESLHAGAPLIAHARLPALCDISAGGQIRLPTVTPETVAAAMTRLLDDDEVAKLRREVGALDLPRWRDFGRRLCDWVAAS